jgi:ankyrin repeat protein
VSDLTEDELAFLQRALDLARGGQTEQLATYVDAGLPVNLTSGAGDSLLILAAYHDHPDTVEALLERGADTARVNDRGQTALAAAVFRRSERSVRALLAAGADPALGPKSALEIARFFELDDMLPLLRSGLEPRS